MRDIEKRGAVLFPVFSLYPIHLEEKGALERRAGSGPLKSEHTAPGFLGSLALCVTQGSVSQPLMNAYDGCHVTILL